VLQAALLFGVGAIVLDVTIGRNDPAAWLLLIMLSTLGAGLFISLGLALSGVAKNEDTAAPVANVIAMPMMFLSGVFFPVDSLPPFISSVSQYLPLTFLADGIRSVAVEGGGIADIGRDLTGLLAWCAAAFVLATRAFRWE
jgi:ABC-2 type transport system permease protein